MVINQSKILLDYILRRHKLAGKYKVGTFSDLAYLAQINLINKSVKHEGMQTYSYVADEISNIQYTSTVSISSDKFPKPDDFMFLMNIDHSYPSNNLTKYASIKLVKETEFNSSVNDAIEYPTNEYPIAKWNKEGWTVRPNNIDEVRITYLKVPAKPKWAYTLTNGREVFDENNSVDFELPESMIHELVLEMLQIAGVNVRESELVQYANNIKKDE